MPYDRFMIAPINSGQQSDLKPFMIMDDSFQSLQNAYTFRGRIRKRFGSVPMNTATAPGLWQQNTRLRTTLPTAINIGTTDNNGDLTIVVPASGYGWRIGQEFAISGVSYYVSVANGIMIRNPNGPGTYTFDTTTGTVVFAGQTHNANVFYYPAGDYISHGNGLALGVMPGNIYAPGQMISIGNDNFNVISDVNGFQNMIGTSITPGTFIMNTDAFGNAVGNISGLFPPPYIIGQSFQIIDGIDNPIFTVINLAAGFQMMQRTPYNENVHVFNAATGGFNINNEGANSPLSFWPTGTAQFNVTTGEFRIESPADASSIVAFYPALPVMGIETFEIGQVNNNPTIAFDQQFAYQYNGTSWNRLGTQIWTGGNANFFWACNWRDGNAQSSNIFVTNFNPVDGIWYWNGLVWTEMEAWLDITHQAPNNETMLSCRILVIFKDRMVALNTWESPDGDPAHAVNYRNRARWAGNGDPLNPAWASNVRGVGYGSFYDCPSKDTITTAAILKDRLIVYFDASTWELVYTGNEIEPFRWQQINIELGAESTFSQIPFDKAILGVGNVGIMSCNGAQVERIDEKIPDSVYNVHAGGDGPSRVAGIRDYFAEMAYWSFPSTSGYIATDQPLYPNRVLVYNYRTGSWAFNDDSITAFGYYYQQNAQTWGSIGRNWEDMGEPWNSGQLAAQPRQIMAGNQEGFTFLINTEEYRNSMGLSITNIDPGTGLLTVINHNLANGSFIIIENCVGVGMLFFNDAIYQVDVATDPNSFSLLTYDPVTNTMIPFAYPAGFVYQGGGTVARVSVIDILTKQYNLYLDKGRNAYIAKVDFLVDNDDGEMTVYTYPSYGLENLVADGQVTGALLGTSVLELTPYPTIPLEATQDYFWHPIYLQAEGESVQFRITVQPGQLTIPLNAFSDFQLNAFTIYAMPTTNRLQ